MLIQQRRIRNLERHLPEEYRGKNLRVGVQNISAFRQELTRAGFSATLDAGETVTPAKIGPVSRFNAEGKQIVRRELPKEDATRMLEWTWEEFRGKDKVEQSDFRFIHYQRYQREQVPPPGVELQIVGDARENYYAVTEAIPYDDAHRVRLLHAVNLCLEHFGVCGVFTDDLVPVLRAPLRRLNWKLLPQGARPWEELKRDLQPVVAQTGKRTRAVFLHRLEVVNEGQPAFTAIGQGGFEGYVVLGFPRLNLYICESTRYGNATYVFAQDWEPLSQMTKADILNQNLQKERIVHNEGWREAIRKLIS
jgi:hypothetical protein